MGIDGINKDLIICNFGHNFVVRYYISRIFFYTVTKMTKKFKFHWKKQALIKYMFIMWFIVIDKRIQMIDWNHNKIIYIFRQRYIEMYYHKQITEKYSDFVQIWYGSLPMIKRFDYRLKYFEFCYIRHYYIFEQIYTYM